MASAASPKLMLVQQRLKDLGHDPGEVDGLWGRATINAVRGFQASRKLVADGVVGPATLRALFEVPIEVGSKLVEVPWLGEARHLLGTQEVPGPLSNPAIVDWARDLGLGVMYPGDDVPWCGLFVAHCIGATLPGEVLPRNPLGALQWGNFGSYTGPREGAVMVFWRESPKSGHGHVAFYVGEDDDSYLVIGGNQSNSVNHAWVARSRFVAARWPATAASIASQPVRKVRGRENLSQNEG